MKVFDKLTVGVLLLMLMLAGCNNSSNSTAGAKDFTFQYVKVAKVAGTKQKYKIDSHEDKSEESGDDNSLNELLDSLEVIATVNTDFENKETPIELHKGAFYNLNIDFDTQKIYPDGLYFRINLINQDLNISSPINIDQGMVDDINETGEYALNIETFIPDDVNLSAGKYLFMVEVTNRDENTSIVFNSLDDIKQYQYMGGFYVNLAENDNEKTIDIVDVLSDKYIDLEQDMTFKDNYPNQPTGESTLVIYSTVSGEEPLTVRGTLSIDGTQYELGLLDTNDGLVKDKLTVKIAGFDTNNVTAGDRTMSYFLKEADYRAILEKAPDLSKELLSDGIEGKIYWSITAANSEVKTNVMEGSTLLISKFVKNFTLEGDDLKTILNPTEESNTSSRSARSSDFLSDFKTGSKYQLSKRTTVNPFPGVPSFATIKHIGSQWENTTKLGIGKVDAALDYDSTYVYIFSGDKFYKYNKSTKKIDGEAISIKTEWPELTLTSIDAAFRWDEKIYFFQGNKYSRLIRNTGAIDNKTSIGPYWDSTLGSFAPFDAAFRGSTTNFKDYVFFIKGDRYIRYDFSKDKSRSSCNIFSFSDEDDNEGLDKGVSAMAVIDTDNKLIFKDAKPKSKLSSLFNEGILFKREANYNKSFGKKNRFRAEFATKNLAQAKWSVPGASAESVSNISAYVYGHKFNIMEIKFEAGVGFRKKHPNFLKITKNETEDSKKEKSTIKYGVNGTFEVAGLTLFTNKGIKEEQVDKELKKGEAKEEVADAKTTAEKKKSSMPKMPNYEWEKKQFIFKHNFFSQIAIPLTVEVGVEGRIAIETAFNVEGAGLSLEVKLPIELGAYVSGGLSVVLTKAEVEAKLNLVHAGAEAKVGAGVELSDDNKINLVGTGNAFLYLKLIQGEFSATGSILAPGLKKVKIPLIGTVYRPTLPEWQDKTWPLYKTGWLMNEKMNLLEYKKSVTIFDINDF